MIMFNVVSSALYIYILELMQLIELIMMENEFEDEEIDLDMAKCERNSLIAKVPYIH